jgi:hypothetical protein
MGFAMIQPIRDVTETEIRTAIGPNPIIFPIINPSDDEKILISASDRARYFSFPERKRHNLRDFLIYRNWRKSELSVVNAMSIVRRFRGQFVNSDGQGQFINAGGASPAIFKLYFQVKRHNYQNGVQRVNKSDIARKDESALALNESPPLQSPNYTQNSREYFDWTEAIKPTSWVQTFAYLCVAVVVANFLLHTRIGNAIGLFAIIAWVIYRLVV